jgi:predicted Zn-dependent peptidase
LTESQPYLLVAYKRPSQFDPSDPVFDVMQMVVSSGRTGWMYQDLVRDKRIALGAGLEGGFPGGKFKNLLAFIAVPSPGHTTEENEKAIYGIVERLKKEKVDDETMKRVKTKVRAGLIRRLDSNSGLAAQLAVYQALYGDWRKMFTAIDDINKVTADDIQRVAREYLVEAKRTVAYTETKPAPASAPKEVGR